MWGEQRDFEEDQGEPGTRTAYKTILADTTVFNEQNDLEFHLRYQEYIELCRQRRTTDALTYVRKNLTTWAETHLMEIQAGMALMIFGEHTVVQGYRVSKMHPNWSK